MRLTADKCDRCGKVVVKHDSANSSDMVETRGVFLFLCDKRENELGRPQFNLWADSSKTTPKLFCPDCLLATVHMLVSTINKRKPSKIPPENIIPGSEEHLSRCPICHNIFSPK